MCCFGVAYVNNVFFKKTRIKRYLLDFSVLGDEEGALRLLDGLLGESGALALRRRSRQRHKGQYNEYHRLHFELVQTELRDH